MNSLTGNNYFTFYFSKELPNSFIYRSENDFEIYNADKQKFLLIDYKSDVERYNEMLYISHAEKTNEMKENTNLIFLDTKENYATDKNGNKLK